ncbi:DUF805 domain-containing protein [Novosphingobium sp. PASSN1]|uniref:DUF805 domain-containing protein n=1 Tax=Novosphingobium sp. PASSN1 TaxID=2015561 RepID=UPI000BD60681|nr:DUF805 domain-containing protein [Novosphingobium sp. PASSN1]OYU36102.1 MAG: hypothetical protein CFE35_07515 [Novosphingobium sp. PASSN1]
MEWMLMPYRRYADFSGRSCRREYWMFTLLSVLVAFGAVALMLAGGLGTAEGDQNPSILFWIGAALIVIWVLGSIIPSIAVQVRRFHDQDRSGWMILLGFIPYVGGIIVFVFMCLSGTRGPNRYGADPLDPSNVDIFN